MKKESIGDEDWEAAHSDTGEKPGDLIVMPHKEKSLQFTSLFYSSFTV